ncbi:aldo/keto reductase [Streptomyces chengbuensis]|uniref:aldo/keto reductase n=1 Tax=Streptomyces chengbuensis TaxID=3053466 RepID=UPI0025B60748|nr:aldo/keto reductase [Streptomyces sp. HUAS CB01]WJY50271.1 aldo/keto reductase [Streptomyces sp. HUAS CB01]
MTDGTIEKVRLGTAGPEVGVQGLGCMGMSEFYGDTDGAAARDTLDAALEAGVTLFDTADIYGSGANEEFLRPFVTAHRDEITLATKFSIVRRADDPTFRGISNEPAYIREAVEASLRRLGVDVIDLYYMHRRDPGVPLAESVGAMAELVRAGKVRHLGLSEVTGAELREAHAVHPIAALQSEWSLFSRSVERSAVGAAADLGVALVPYSPLGRGFLTGSFVNAAELSEDDFRRMQPRFTGDAAAANAALLAPVRTIAAAHGATPAQIALAWVQQRADVHGLPVVPIPGTRRRGRLEENAAATRITLTPDELALLEPIAERVVGERYPDMSSTSDSRE